MLAVVAGLLLSFIALFMTDDSLIFYLRFLGSVLAVFCFNIVIGVAFAVIDYDTVVTI